MHQPPDAARAQERCQGQIVRVTTTEARVLFDRWCAGAATVTVPRLLLQQALDLAPRPAAPSPPQRRHRSNALDDRVNGM